MLGDIDFSTLRAGEPLYLWFLVLPAIVFALGSRFVLLRRSVLRRSRAERLVPLRERHAVVGDLGFWFSATLATSLCIVALARPQATVSVVRRASADFIILLDGSASMYTRDVAPDRWQRSVRFIREFADALSWKSERVALALFAHRASPQVRLTRDPNALFFFLDHLGAHSPFRLDEDPTWDTNIEDGLNWGVNLVEADEELFGKTQNVKAFIVISDGQAWSGEVANAIQLVRQRDAFIHVVGIGTTTGGIIPTASTKSSAEPIRAILDRASLGEIARSGGGEYFEIGRQPDRVMASRIIASVQRQATVVTEEERHQDLYAQFLVAAALSLCLGALFLRDATELWWHMAISMVALLMIASVVG